MSDAKPRAVFSDETIRIADLCLEAGAWRQNLHRTDHSFDRCVLTGPGAIALHSSCAMLYPRLNDCDFVAVRGAALAATVVFTNSMFSHCTFDHLVIFMLPQTAEKMLENLAQIGQRVTVIGLNEPKPERS